MLNYLWGFMIILGIIYGAFTGHIADISNGFLDSSKEAVTLCITMLGVMGFWNGMMEVATVSGIIDSLNRFISPFTSFLFPNIPKNHISRKYITANIIANILGLGWAATPAGLKAMEALAELKKDSDIPTCVASDEMCTFLILNISSLQLVPVSIICYRNQYGAVNPAGITLPALIATAISTITAIVYCKFKMSSKYSAK